MVGILNKIYTATKSKTFTTPYNYFISCNKPAHTGEEKYIFYTFLKEFEIKVSTEMLVYRVHKEYRQNVASGTTSLFPNRVIRAKVSLLTLLLVQNTH